MSEMSVEVQVGSVVVDAASVAHASRHKHGGLDPIATETPGAYAIPKADATGKLAAGFIPTGLISGGISTLDDLSDGSSYKRIAAAVATALNADTYTANDADKVSAFGIGLDTAPILNTEAGIDAAKSGLYRFYSESEGPFLGAGTVLLIMKWAAVGTTVIAIQNDGGMKYRYHGSTSWKSIWTSYSDGNGGQPPAPKPKNTASSEIGSFYSFSAGDNTAIALPAGGTWVVVAAYYVRISDSVILNGLTIQSNQTLRRSGGDTVLAALSGYACVVHAWRVE